VEFTSPEELVSDITLSDDATTTKVVNTGTSTKISTNNANSETKGGLLSSQSTIVISASIGVIALTITFLILYKRKTKRTKGRYNSQANLTNEFQSNSNLFAAQNAEAEAYGMKDLPRYAAENISSNYSTLKNMGTTLPSKNRIIESSNNSLQNSRNRPSDNKIPLEPQHYSKPTFVQKYSPITDGNSGKNVNEYLDIREYSGAIESIDYGKTAIFRVSNTKGDSLVSGFDSLASDPMSIIYMATEEPNTLVKFMTFKSDPNESNFRNVEEKVTKVLPPKPSRIESQDFSNTDRFSTYSSPYVIESTSINPTLSLYVTGKYI
jgi:hypothetical protein